MVTGDLFRRDRRVKDHLWVTGDLFRRDRRVKTTYGEGRSFPPRPAAIEKPESLEKKKLKELKLPIKKNLLRKKIT